MSFQGGQSSATPEIIENLKHLVEVLTADLNTLKAAAQLEVLENRMQMLHDVLNLYHFTCVPIYEDAYKMAAVEDLKLWYRALTKYKQLTQVRCEIRTRYLAAEVAFKTADPYFNARHSKSAFALEQQLAGVLNDLHRLTGHTYPRSWTGMGAVPKLNDEDIRHAGRWQKYDNSKAETDLACWMVRRKTSLGLKLGDTFWQVDWESQPNQDRHSLGMTSGNWSEDLQFSRDPNGSLYGNWNPNRRPKNGNPFNKPPPTSEHTPNAHPFPGSFGSTKPSNASKAEQEEYARQAREWSEKAQRDSRNSRPPSPPPQAEPNYKQQNQPRDESPKRKQNEHQRERPDFKPTFTSSTQLGSQAANASLPKVVTFAESVAAWREASELVLQNRHAELTSFPDPPPYKCDLKSCMLSLPNRAIKTTCPHGIRKAFKGVMGLDAKIERTKWHPSRFCANAEMRDEWNRRATEMFHVIQQIHDEKK